MLDCMINSSTWGFMDIIRLTGKADIVRDPFSACFSQHSATTESADNPTALVKERRQYYGVTDVRPSLVAWSSRDLRVSLYSEAYSQERPQPYAACTRVAGVVQIL